ncbi:Chemotaxis response regulator protein-glutamate methylesterase [bioreactor metagenome]|uniref:Chemotaxis response regulator protein-glutamate methylesterase n=1 Tax=bioreactor metagenome TaxID=1076179 RepID=A0A644TAS9_9ZZZZ|nr:response regulator [Desulfitobacterium hafniense]MEA5024113.1 response regulator [Desulfitobacterium hafniense]
MEVIVVDDEELSLNRLGNMLAGMPGVEVCGLFYTAAEALRYINENKPDAVFLDICIPETDGLALANKIKDIDGSAKVVFVTGYDEYAVRAFELEAVDYLMKPISHDRLEKTVQRLQRARIGTGRQSKPKMVISCFGGFRAAAGDSDSGIVNWRSPKTEELFAFLIFKKNVSRDEIVNTLWDGLEPDRALTNINSTMYYIRKALSPHGLEKCIAATRKEIRIDSELISCDLYEFERLLRGRPSSKDRVETLDRLAELYKGELFQGKAYEWSFSKSRSLESGFISALLETAEYYREKQGYEQAEKMYKRALEIDPFNEEICGHIIQICLKMGKKSEALRLYLQMEKFLMEELGEKPQDKLKKLFEEQ